MIIQKQYARRNIEGYTSPYEDSLTYLSIGGLEVAVVKQVLHAAMAASLARDIVAEEDGSALEHFIEFAGDAYHPETWVIAYQDNKPVGLVFPQRYDDKPEEGSLFMIGVVPEFRGKGLSKILHAKGLELLASVGVKEYVGSTDVKNEPMIRTFASNGCRLYAVRDIEIGVGLV
jgi:GNAT superfamily N-acetyltransferase